MPLYPVEQAFYPDKPKEWNRIMWVINKLGIKKMPRFYWQTKTVCDFDDQGAGINRDCKDFSKSTVEQHFGYWFEYTSHIPANGKGKAVIKSEKQAAHDGRIVDLPYQLQPHEICQKLINTGGAECRVLVINGEASCVLLKQKDNGFGTGAKSFDFRTLEECFDEDFIEKFNMFCQSMLLDYAEVDVLRDVDDELFYIIDVNQCPGGGTKEFFEMNQESLDNFAEAHRPLFNTKNLRNAL
jgi:hypothetical protein